MRFKRPAAVFSEAWLAQVLERGECGLLSGSLSQDDDKGKRTGKYGSVLSYEDGIRFDSDGEKIRYQYLKRYATMDEISDLVVKPVFVLQPSFLSEGRKKRAITYTADFQYTRGDVVWVEDWKSYSKRLRGPFLTEAFKRTHKQLMYTHPELEGRFIINTEPWFLP